MIFHNLTTAMQLLADNPGVTSWNFIAFFPCPLAACKSLISGKDCSFTSPQGTVAGTCWAPEGKPLACKPKGAPGGGAAPQI